MTKLYNCNLCMNYYKNNNSIINTNKYINLTRNELFSHFRSNKHKLVKDCSTPQQQMKRNMLRIPRRLNSTIRKKVNIQTEIFMDNDKSILSNDIR